MPWKESWICFDKCANCLLLHSDQAELRVSSGHQRLQLGERHQRERLPRQLRFWGNRGRRPVKRIERLRLFAVTKEMNQLSWAEAMGRRGGFWFCKIVASSWRNHCLKLSFNLLRRLLKLILICSQTSREVVDGFGDHSPQPRVGQGWI